VAELLFGISKLRGYARRSDIVGLSLILDAVQNDLRLHMDSAVESMQLSAHGRDESVPSATRDMHGRCTDARV